MTKKLKFLTTLVVITAMSWMVAKVASAHGWGDRDDFKLAFAARLVTGGMAPHNVAVDLTSNCGAQRYSNTCYTNAAFVQSAVSFKPDRNSMSLSQITNLVTDYNMNGTDCSGGAPRFVIFTNSNNFEVNFGQAPFGGNCYYGWQNTGNMTSLADPTLRWQVNVGNTFLKWSDVVAAHGSEVVVEVAIVLDGGWIAPRGQDVTVDNFTINKEVMDFSEENH